MVIKQSRSIELCGWNVLPVLGFAAYSADVCRPLLGGPKQNPCHDGLSSGGQAQGSRRPTPMGCGVSIGVQDATQQVGGVALSMLVFSFLVVRTLLAHERPPEGPSSPPTLLLGWTIGAESQLCKCCLQGQRPCAADPCAAFRQVVAGAPSPLLYITT